MRVASSVASTKSATVHRFKRVAVVDEFASSGYNVPPPLSLPFILNKLWLDSGGIHNTMRLLRIRSPTEVDVLNEASSSSVHPCTLDLNGRLLEGRSTSEAFSNSWMSTFGSPGQGLLSSFLPDLAIGNNKHPETIMQEGWQGSKGASRK